MATDGLVFYGDGASTAILLTYFSWISESEWGKLMRVHIKVSSPLNSAHGISQKGQEYPKGFS